MVGALAWLTGLRRLLHGPTFHPVSNCWSSQAMFLSVRQIGQALGLSSCPVIRALGSASMPCVLAIDIRAKGVHVSWHVTDFMLALAFIGADHGNRPVVGQLPIGGHKLAMGSIIRVELRRDRGVGG